MKSMKVIFKTGNIEKRLRGGVVVVGVFDGVHRGHQHLIGCALKEAYYRQVPAVVCTFDPHPLHVLKPKNYLPFLVTLRHRLKLIDDLGVDACVVLKFDRRFSQIKGQAFCEKYLKGLLAPRTVWVGENFSFGKEKSGSVWLLQREGDRLGFKVHVDPLVNSGSHPISSTRIRRLIRAGRLKAAGKLLGRPVSVLARVERGDRRGRNLGFPTANINPWREVYPPCGVYLVRVEVNKKEYYGIANLGWRPSVKQKKEKVNLEVHIFSFHQNLYQKEIEVSFLKKIRKERKFPSEEKLQQQIARDQQKALKLLKEISA